ncbi:MAG: ABC transporter substrate-binding protein [Deltaproteobacteria bacterium]
MERRELSWLTVYRFGIFVLVSLVMIGLVGWGGTVIAAPAREPIKIGVTTEITGPLQVLGSGILRGIELYAEKANNTGGILGRRVEVISLDDKTRPDEAVKNATYLISTKKVDMIMRGASSDSTLAVSALCNKEKVPMFAMGGSGEITMSRGHRYIFRATFNTITQSKATAKYIFDKWPNMKKFFIVGHDYEFGRSLAKDFWEQMKKLKPDAEVLSEVWPKLSETDYSNYIAAAIRAKPEIVFLALGRGTEFYKQGKPYGLYKIAKVITPAYFVDESFSWAKADIPEGVVFDGPPYYAINNSLNKDFVNQFKQKYPKVAPGPTPSDYFGYVSTLMALEAIKRAGTGDKEKMIDSLEGLTMDTPVGMVTIRAIDHQSTFPIYMGVLGWDDALKHAALKDVERISGEGLLPTAAEVQAARAKGR